MIRLDPVLPGVRTNGPMLELSEHVGAELFPCGVIAVIACDVNLTNSCLRWQQCRGSLKKRGSLCKGLHISILIPFSLPLSSTNDIHDAAIIFRLSTFFLLILSHRHSHYCLSAPCNHVFFLLRTPNFLFILQQYILAHL